MNAQSPRRWLRFSLRTLVLLLTVTAVATWMYSDGWQRWRWYREQQEFEQQVRGLKAGQRMREFQASSRKIVTHKSAVRGTQRIEVPKYARYIRYDWPNATYIVYCDLNVEPPLWPDITKATRVEVYRLSAIPSHYAPKASAAQDILGRIQSMNQMTPWSWDDDALLFTVDFLQMISGNRQDSLGFEYELIYADPPVK
jgi:hypothetical protein